MHEDQVYKRMYLYLFNAVTDALNHMETDSARARILLKEAQQRTEDIYMQNMDTEK